CEVNPIPVKSTMNMLGFNVGSLRLPLTEMEDKHKVAMSQLLSRMPQEMLA
ncbi:MAG: dihydrodipicolinate synthase family protein, partial [Anaerovibrio sp.]|nr:dihydrodipicolinate synthase family protein [Anaerovibrio sp.]